MIKAPLLNSNNVYLENLEINKQERSAIKEQIPFAIWFTGLSGSGKSTIANLVEKKLHSMNRHTYILDGDNVRHGLNRDLGFTDVDRVENVRRISEVTKLMIDAGLITLVSFISPFGAERQQARAIMEEGEFIEVFVDTPVDICQKRDVKGLYERAIRGEVKNFTGITSPYEAPKNPEIILKTVDSTPEESADEVIRYLQERKAF